ncbi:patched transmembrane domain-containing protein, putative [Eimeria necatrix]|uniref:Patched transmembrane domain-containing protein, putative n=1 Tax=Eimeria necatrix TaxID=51315 RepID=U6MRE3_9EIME|nr:patched transmembrane domain-containing protein, putative [Eimeria necatrix]CDJ64235.1 patched transmembrane domain-containing protein, putative [Eimeria necatrix]
MLDAAFARHGMIVYDHAWKFIVGFGLLSAAMAAGIFFRKNEFDMFKLYSYPGAPSHDVRQLLEATFKPQRFNYFFVSRNDNILTREGMQQLSGLVAAVKGLTVARDEVVTDEYGNELESSGPQGLPPVLTYEDLCVRDSWEDCSVLSVLELYSSERQWGRPITTSEWPLAANFHSRKANHLESLLGDMRVSVIDGGDHQIHRVTGAAASLLRFDLQGHAAVAPYSAALERKIENVAKSFSAEGFTLTYKLERSIADELMRSSSMGPAETVALVLATLTVLTYTVVVNTTTNYRTKTLPAIVSVASTLLGYAGGAGFIYFCGVEHTPPADATPFLVLGIGVDNAFVLLNSYCLTFLHDTPRQRIVSTARDAGVSITITTMTSVAALVIGAVCPFFSISKFSIVTAFCLAWSYVLAQTIFLGCLSLDARREAFYTRRAREGALAAQKAFSSQPRFPARPSAQGKGAPCEAREAPQAQVQLAAGPRESPAAAAQQQQLSSSSAAGPEGLSVDMQGCSDPREGELLVALKKLSTYELASLMTFRMQHIWQRHREIVAKYFQSTAARFEQREGPGGGCGFSKLFGLLRKTPKTEPTDPPAPSAAAQPPVRAASLEAGTLQEDQASAKAAQPEEPDSSVAAEPPAAEEALLRKEESEAASEALQLQEDAEDSGPRAVRMRMGKPADGYMLMEEKEFLVVLDRYINEPKGNVGKIYRRILGKYYCRLMGNRWVRRLVFVGFAALVGIAIYGVTQMETGITADEITPTDSHLIPFFADRAKYFSSLGEEVTVFFPKRESWADKEVKERIMTVNRELMASGHALALYNGMARFLEEKNASLQDGNEREFYDALYSWLQEDPVGRQFRTSFLWDTRPPGSPGPRLAAWKFTFWLPHSLDADLLLDWFKHTQKLIRDSAEYFECHAFTPLALLWESDPFTVKSTVNSLLSALLAIIFMTVLLIPDLLSVLIVAFTVLLVDLCLFGFMTLWGLRLNLITMVNLLLAIGYSVDSTLFLLHAFTHGCGATREARMTEGMLMMGCPVANGMLSTLLAVFYLVGTTKFVLIAFFRMMVLVLVLSFGFGMILLPAVLCIIGPLPPNPPVVSYSAAKPVEGTATIPPQKASAALAIEGESSAPVVGGSAAAYESPVLKKVD